MALQISYLLTISGVSWDVTLCVLWEGNVTPIISLLLLLLLLLLLIAYSYRQTTNVQILYIHVEPFFLYNKILISNIAPLKKEAFRAEGLDISALSKWRVDENKPKNHLQF
jgi:hypothetical protein